MNQYQITETLLPVRPGDLDSAGHVNNARVLEYLEHGRWDWLRKNGLSINGLIIPVVVRMEVDYETEIRWSDVRIETCFMEDDEAVYKAKFHQLVLVGAEGKTAVRAISHIAFIGAGDRKICTVLDFIENATAVCEACDTAESNLL